MFKDYMFWLSIVLYVLAYSALRQLGLSEEICAGIVIGQCAAWQWRYQDFSDEMLVLAGREPRRK